MAIVIYPARKLMAPPLDTDDCKDEQHERCKGEFWDKAPCHCIHHILSDSVSTKS